MNDNQKKELCQITVAFLFGIFIVLFINALLNFQEVTKVNVKQLEELFKDEREFLEVQSEYAGQDGEYDIFERFSAQIPVIDSIVSWLEECQNKIIYLPVVIRQLKNEFPDFDERVFHTFLRAKKEEVYSKINMLEIEYKELSKNAEMVREYIDENDLIKQRTNNKNELQEVLNLSEEKENLFWEARTFTDKLLKAGVQREIVKLAYALLGNNKLHIEHSKEGFDPYPYCKHSTKTYCPVGNKKRYYKGKWREYVVYGHTKLDIYLEVIKCLANDNSVYYPIVSYRREDE